MNYICLSYMYYNYESVILKVIDKLYKFDWKKYKKLTVRESPTAATTLISAGLSS